MSKLLSIIIAAAFVFVALDCSKSSNSPTQPSTSNPPPSLNAAPPSVTVAVGAHQSVTVSGGTPPYAIVTAPNSTATALLVNADSATAILQITGVTVASVSTSVVVKDNTMSTAKSVTVPINVQ